MGASGWPPVTSATRAASSPGTSRSAAPSGACTSRRAPACAGSLRCQPSSVPPERRRSVILPAASRPSGVSKYVADRWCSTGSAAVTPATPRKTAARSPGQHRTSARSPGARSSSPRYLSGSGKALSGPGSHRSPARPRAYDGSVVTGAVVLAGGRSSRMGTPKAALEWHGSTLLRRTVGIAARATGGPVVVVRASGQDLPELPAPVTVVDDPREGKGPVQGIAAGLAALAGQAEAAFVTSTDLPFLHPAFIRRVVRALRTPGSAAGPDVALPVARGYPQPLAAAYRTGLAALAERLVEDGQAAPRVPVRRVRRRPARRRRAADRPGARRPRPGPGLDAERQHPRGLRPSSPAPGA